MPFIPVQAAPDPTAPPDQRKGRFVPAKPAAKSAAGKPPGVNEFIDAPNVVTPAPSAKDRFYASQKENPLSGAGEALTAAVTGTAASAIGGFAALPVATLTGVDRGEAALEKFENAMTYRPRTPEGQAMLKVMAWPFEQLGKLGKAAGQKSMDIGAPPEVAAGVETGIDLIPSLWGMRGVRTVPAMTTRALDIARKARDRGLLLPPTQANPSILNQALEGLAGSPLTLKKISVNNQPKLQSMAKEALAIPENSPLSYDTIRAQRLLAGEQGYEPIRTTGRVAADQRYYDTLLDVAKPYTNAEREFGKLTPSGKRVVAAIQNAWQPAFDASAAVDQVRHLRDLADQLTRGENKDIKGGNAIKRVAGAIDDQLSRHLIEIGASPEVIENYLGSRRFIAQSYLIEKALLPDETLDASVLAKEMKKNPRLLTGNLREIAEFATEFPHAVQLPERASRPNFTPADALMAAFGAHEKGKAGLLLGALRPAIRYTMASRPYQKMFVQPSEYGIDYDAVMQNMTALGIVPFEQLDTDSPGK